MLNKQINFQSPASILDQTGLRRIEAHPDTFDAQGQLALLPAEWWQQWNLDEIRWFCHKQALYSIPTAELADWLAREVHGREFIEIGAGRGDLARIMGYRATDSYQQRDDAQTAAVYAMTGQPVIDYGAHVEKLDALKAVKRYKPDTVLAQWVTQRYDPKRHKLGGNMHGVDEVKLVQSIQRYIFVGNAVVQQAKPLLQWRSPTRVFKADWIISRASSPQNNFIAIWE